ncbi:MAG: Na/Pi cotransporter family protein [Kiritimatiellia bacterium]|jgi:phosphate:Na+ symporter|nr:Na/Pi cotransporter family protein [Kiritimatiellia bacterium]MDP6629827.1 Na/Pi cotransporter family protein [Kiritimatiellia bacterium]MDP6809750.1 Na/Pi cotransporter family protein [Kiritimatiellia bacterium]MDP7025140.1 Na/Pi cotransporter family protein [Kiritimatiellia bacterium]
MNGELGVGIVFAVIGGLCIFLMGMKHMSDGMQAIAGRRLRRMINAVTDRRLMACGTGTVITALIQSSSITTVMVVGLVNAGVMTLAQAIGVILGADLGTTITAWIVSLNVLQYGLPVLGLAGFFYLFTKSDRVRYIAMLTMGIGMIFFGLEIMKDGLHPLREAEGFIAWFSRFQPKDYWGVLRCIAVGAAVTAIVQSSSATIAITITLARTGVIEFDTAVALVLGQNIGTTITAYLASLGTATNARRAAYAHILMKVIGVFLMSIFFFHYVGLLDRFISTDLDIAKRIAISHTIFNVMLVCLFLPCIQVIAALLQRLVPDRPHKEAHHLTFLDVRMLDTPAFGVEQSFDEIKRMGESVQKMFGWLRTQLTSAEPDEELERKLFHRENVLDVVQKEIMEFLAEMAQGNVPAEVALESRKQLRMADEYESISDYLTAILKLHLKEFNSEETFSEEAREHLLALHDSVAEYVAMITAAVHDDNADILSKAETSSTQITRQYKDALKAHMTRLESGRCSPLGGLMYTDMLQSYHKIKDHCLNIAEALAGEK